MRDEARQDDERRAVVLITGVGRARSIGAQIARYLAGPYDVAFSYWDGYDATMPFGSEPSFHDELAEQLRASGARVLPLEADLADPETPAALIARVGDELGPVRAMVLSHAHSVDSGILDTSVAAFDAHFAVNTRASWLLIKAFAEAYEGPHGWGRIVALTSDHTAHNVPYGASKGALDRIVKAAAVELAPLGITANLVNPGPIDTGWMTPELAADLAAQTALGRLGTPKDTADVVAFLLSYAGGWINGQLLHSNGGFNLGV
ncbi:SDR family oxidoreductase [Leifsonia sp. 71-9]|uniref:SDR family oxidoreductase n=1 Tax=Leifsonia sp. 71-9 TaxID=1895934 RepID=UPI00092B56A5|nr:SDR family oxidoreductase [Leifsonia sp. 71-9]OJX72549.1 MAG: short-chain dehydrogenase [Leifsonia sp. 71-9]